LAKRSNRDQRGKDDGVDKHVQTEIYEAVYCHANYAKRSSEYRSLSETKCVLKILSHTPEHYDQEPDAAGKSD
jgi:hypothetical protein